MFVIAVIVALRATMVTMPYRVLELEYYRWTRVLYGSLAVAAGCVALWIKLASTRVQKTGGWLAGFALLFLFLIGSSSGPHSIISVRNICVNQLREIDGAKEQWAEVNGKKTGEDVDVRGVAEFLRAKKIPECPKGGAYSIGKVDEEPRCSEAQHRVTSVR